MIPLRSITSRTITAPASLVRRSTRDSITTPALKLGWKVDGVSPMGCSALADITAQMPEAATHLAQEPAQSAVSMNREGSPSTAPVGRGALDRECQVGSAAACAEASSRRDPAGPAREKAGSDPVPQINDAAKDANPRPRYSGEGGGMPAPAPVPTRR